MAVPVIASVSTQAAPGFGNASLTFSKPASTAAGDLLLVHVATRDGASCTPPSGWTLADQTSGGGADPVLDSLYYRVADGSEASSFTFAVTTTTSDRSVGAIVRVTGADGTAPVNAVAATGFSGDHATVDSPSVTTTAADCLILLTNGQASNSLTNTIPAGATAVWDYAPNAEVETTGARTSASGTGATGAYTWSVTGFTFSFVLRTTAIAPSGGGGGGGGGVTAGADALHYYREHIARGAA